MQVTVCHRRELFFIATYTFADDLALQASIVCLYQSLVEVNSSFRSIDSINAHGQSSWCHYGHGGTSSGEGARCTRWPVSTHHVFQKDQHVSIPYSSLSPNTWQTSEVH